MLMAWALFGRAAEERPNAGGSVPRRPSDMIAVPPPVAGEPISCFGAFMPDDQREAISAVISHAPEWLRRNMLSDDRVARTAAEETLAAMIVNALKSTEAR
jgi:hypothetical protein